MKIKKRDGSLEELNIEKIRLALRFAFKGLTVSMEELEADARLQFREGMSTKEIQAILIRTAAEKISPQEPDWQYVAARLLLYDLYKEVARTRGYKIPDNLHENYEPYKPEHFFVFIKQMVERKLYGKYLLKSYSEKDLVELGKYIEPKRDLLFPYAGLKVLTDKYLIKTKNGYPIELPQEMYMLIAMSLAVPERDRVAWAKKFYNLLSSHKVSVATPTMMNARRPIPQLSSCFVVTVNDDLYDIFDNVQKAAQVSKFAGGLGVYLGKIRATGSTIRQFKGASSGVIPVVKVFNDVMSYVDQLGMRKGAATITLDVWHKDVLDFLEVKTNAGDERKKAHDIHPAISIPDIFMKRVQEGGKWTLFDPYYARKHIKPYGRLLKLLSQSFKVSFHIEKSKDRICIKILFHSKAGIDNALDLIKRELVRTYKNKYHLTFSPSSLEVLITLPQVGLEDLYGEIFEENYLELENLSQLIPKGSVGIDAFNLWKKILTTAFETGEPYIFFRDNANKMNPNKHCGMIYSSNLCMEITQNMSPSKQKGWKLDYTKGEITQRKQAGDMVVCNLGSINLGKVHSKQAIEKVVPTLVRMLDNAIEMNFYAVPEAEYTNKRYRAIGIGVSNYHYCLVKNGISWESEEHLKFADKLFEMIAFYAVSGSASLAKERGSYPLFEGSDWQKGVFFGKTVEELKACSKQNDNNLPWDKLKKKVETYGIRNAYLLALMPTGSTSLIMGATPSTDPIFAKFYKEENMSGILPQVPPEIDRFFWHYKSAYDIDQTWIIKAASARQKWIDQAQSLNLFINPVKIKGRTLSNIYTLAWQLGLKSVYYLRSKSISDIEECESCSA